jgi:hypothetical protein
MLDLETLSVKPDAVILTFGAVKFNPFAQEPVLAKMYLRVDVDQQIALNRRIDEGTIKWWSEQAEDVRNEALGDENRVSLDEFTSQLNKFVVGVDEIWSQGTVFDIIILENLYRQLEKPIPWQYYQIRDSRTLFQVHGDPREKGKAGLHNALEDCISQASAVQMIFNKLGIKKAEPWK